jgi:hypothetical protein
MFIAPEEGESRESFLTRVEQVAKLLGGESLYSLMRKKATAKEQEPAPEGPDGKA